MQRMARLAALFALGMVAATAWAQPIQNGSFEVGPLIGNPPGFAQLPNGSTSVTAWTVTGSNIDFIAGYWVAADGTRSLDLNGTGTGGIEQVFNTVAGRTYQVDFALAGNPEGGPAVKNLQVQATGGSASNYTFDTTGHSVASMGWETRSYTFTATGASTTLSFTSLDTGAYGPALDNVVVTTIAVPRSAAAVPTLSQWAFLSLGALLGLFALGRIGFRSRS